MSNKERYNDMVVKRFIKTKRKEEETTEMWRETGYLIPWAAAGTIFGTCVGAGLAFYVIYKFIMFFWDAAKGAM